MYMKLMKRLFASSFPLSFFLSALFTNNQT